MYWPIGSPRVYAAVLSGSSTNETVDNGDDVPSSALRSQVNTPNEESNSGFEGNGTSKTGNVEENSLHDGQTGENLIRVPAETRRDPAIIGLKVSRGGNLFTTITADTLTVWQTQPTAVVAAVVRSDGSLKKYGPNISLLVRPDCAIFVVHTSLGFLVTYSLATDPDARVYKLHYSEGQSNRIRRQKGGHLGYSDGESVFGPPGGGGPFREVSLRFRMVIKVDAGITEALALDDELVVATQKPPAVQCIRWTPDSTGNQTSTELMSRMPWMPKKTHIVYMGYDRPMNMSTWITSDGKAHAVQRIPAGSRASDSSEKLFRGYCFHEPKEDSGFAVATAINARFSMIAVGTAGGEVHLYTVRDYVGNIPLSFRLESSYSASTSGKVNCLTYSPDGYCLFAGFEKGWATWSVFGKPGGSSFSSGWTDGEKTAEGWLAGVRHASWINGGSDILLVGEHDESLWSLEFARSAATGSLLSANLSRTLLHTRNGFLVYRGYDLPDLTSISAEATLWQQVQMPARYIAEQWPIRMAVISPDGRYVAVAGRRGLMHYSVNSGRWKMFEDSGTENEFSVRGGMCWHQHILIAAVENGDGHEIRLYSRELALDNTSILQIEKIPSSVVLLSPSGEDSLLVYTHDNVLYHFIIATMSGSVKLVQVGQIEFHGIVRAPTRVRAMSWILPDSQLQDGDPSQDVATASVVLLVDGKLVLLQPAVNDTGERKYDMRVVAQNVEYYVQMRDQPGPHSHVTGQQDVSGSTADALPDNEAQLHGLRDSLWIFDGNDIRVWTDLQDILRSSVVDSPHALSSSIQIPIDFYPVSVLLNKGIILGMDSEFSQRRDLKLAFFRIATRTQLFLPQILRLYLSNYNSPAALHLSHQYQHLLYFPHALEILLHNVLDEEVEAAPSLSSPSSFSQSEPVPPLLPTVLSFLSSFPTFLDILVQCTRKTELRSWRTLFAHLPPPQDLFEEALQRGMLKTAGGYLLVLHTFEGEEELVSKPGNASAGSGATTSTSSSQHLIRLLARARDEGDWDLCKELARFLMSVDESGDTLREALELVGLRQASPGRRLKAFSLDAPSAALGKGKGKGKERSGSAEVEQDVDGKAEAEAEAEAVVGLGIEGEMAIEGGDVSPKGGGSEA